HRARGGRLSTAEPVRGTRRRGSTRRGARLVRPGPRHRRRTRGCEPRRPASPGPTTRHRGRLGGKVERDGALRGPKGLVAPQWSISASALRTYHHTEAGPIGRSGSDEGSATRTVVPWYSLATAALMSTNSSVRTRVFPAV